MQRTLLFLAALALFLAGTGRARAGPITWGSATNISGDTDVVTTGTLVGALNPGPFGVPNTTVNGVTFQAAAFTHPFSDTFGNFGRDLHKLYSRTLDPLRQGPHVIRQLRHHGRCPSPAALGLQRPHRPAEVGAVVAEEGRRPMRPPVLRDAIRLPDLPCIAVAVRPVVPLHERRVDRAAGRRGLQRRRYRRGRAEAHPVVTLTTRPCFRASGTVA